MAPPLIPIAVGLIPGSVDLGSAASTIWLRRGVGVESEPVDERS